MPLLTATGGVADHVCANCGNERHLTSGDWIVAEGDDSVFSTPPCTCGATESFSWHNWVYVTHPKRPRDLPPEERFDHSPKPDHTHHGAEQMVLIERVATALGRKQAKHADKTKQRYKQAPSAPTQAKVREMVKKMRGEP